jgi:hypothetical protein
MILVGVAAEEVSQQQGELLADPAGNLTGALEVRALEVAAAAVAGLLLSLA